MELTPIETEIVKGQIVEALRTVFDSEIPVNIYEMGLIYDIDVASDGDVEIQMTLTSPGCPVAGSLPGEVEQKAREVTGDGNVHVELVWEPTWNMDMMTDEAKLTLGML